MDYASFCHWETGCRRKIRFSHAGHAWSQIRRILHSDGGVSVHRLEAYHCDFCSGYHIGHSRHSRLF